MLAASTPRSPAPARGSKGNECSRGYARSRPEHGYAVWLCQQDEAELSSEKICDPNTGGEYNWFDPGKRTCGCEWPAPRNRCFSFCIRLLPQSRTYFDLVRLTAVRSVGTPQLRYVIKALYRHQYLY